MRIELSDRAREFALELLGQFDSYISAKSLWSSMHKGLLRIYYPGDKPFSATGSMGAPQDWESVASFWHRAGKIPHVIIDGEFAEEIVPGAEVSEIPSVTLESAAESLCRLFDGEFEHAAEAVAG